MSARPDGIYTDGEFIIWILDGRRSGRKEQTRRLRDCGFSDAEIGEFIADIPRIRLSPKELLEIRKEYVRGGIACD